MKMGPNTRAKQVDAARKVMPGVDVVGYAIGRAGPDPILVVVGLVVGWAALAVAFYAATGGIFIIGILPVLLVQYLVSPPRGVAVLPDEVALLARGLMLGRPSKLLATVPRSDVEPVEASGGRVRVRVGTEHVWLSRHEEEELRLAIAVATRGRIPRPEP